MKILRVAQTVYPEVPGGGSYHVHAMSRDQAEMGHDVTVLTVTDDNSKPRRERRDGYTVVRRKPTVELLKNEISAGVAKFLAKANDYDVIHAHSHMYFSTNLAAIKRRLGDTPLAITNHSVYSQSAPKWIFDTYLRTFGRWTFNQSEVIFCYTETDKQRLQELGVNSKIAVVPNGIDTERFTPEGPKSELIESNGPVILFVGRLVEGKRPSDAIRAVAQVFEEYPDVELYLCGDGPLREELEELAVELGITGSIYFLGHVPYDEMPKVYRSGDVLVLPSRAEGLPRTVLEAMASETPSITAALPQLERLLSESGKTVPVADIESFAEKLIGFLDNPSELSRMAEIGRKTAIQEFTWEDTASSTTTELMRIADQQPQ